MTCWRRVKRITTSLLRKIRPQDTPFFRKRAPNPEHLSSPNRAPKPAPKKIFLPLSQSPHFKVKSISNPKLACLKPGWQKSKYFFKEQ
jgi:hypothetical protein